MHWRIYCSSPEGECNKEPMRSWPCNNLLVVRMRPLALIVLAGCFQLVSACFPVAVVAEMTSKRAANKENIPLSRCFNLDVDDNDFEIMPRFFQPKNTQLSTLWGLKTFADG